MKVKVFHGNTADWIDRKVNSFIEENGYTLVDIKISSYYNSNEETQGIWIVVQYED